MKKNEINKQDENEKLVQAIITSDINKVQQTLLSGADPNYIPSPLAWKDYVTSGINIASSSPIQTFFTHIYPGKTSKGAPTLVTGDTVLHLAMRRLQPRKKCPENDIVDELVKGGGDLQKRNSYLEKPVDVAPDFAYREREKWIRATQSSSLCLIM